MARPGLTRREIEVLVLLARGLSNKEIAAQLVISPKTVGSHVEHIYRRSTVSNRAQASLFAMQHGLLPELERSKIGQMPDVRAARRPYGRSHANRIHDHAWAASGRGRPTTAG